MTLQRQITAKRGDTLRHTFTVLGDLTGRTNLWFTAKKSHQEDDNEAYLKISEENGLEIFNQALAADGALASLTVVDEETGIVDLYISHELTKLFDTEHRKSFVFDIQVKTDTDVLTPVEGALTLSRDVTRNTV